MISFLIADATDLYNKLTATRLSALFVVMKAAIMLQSIVFVWRISFCIREANKFLYDCSYMDEDLVCKSKWSLVSSVSLWDIGVADIYLPSRNLERENVEEEKKERCSLGSFVLFSYIWNSIQMTSSQKRSIQYMDLLPNEIIKEEFLYRLPVKMLMTLKCVSKIWNDFISDDYFRRRYQFLQEVNNNTYNGFICSNKTDDTVRLYGFCKANKFLYTSKNYIEKEEPESFEYLKRFGRYVIAASKGLLLVFGHNPKILCICDVVSKKHVNILTRIAVGNLYPWELGFKCVESSGTKHHFCYEVVCVEVPSDVYGRDTGYVYGVCIFSSKTGTWREAKMKSWFRFKMHSCSIAKVIGGVFHWHDQWLNNIIAYDSDDPTGRVVLIELPSAKDSTLEGKIMRYFEGTNDGSLQFITIRDMIINVWILTKSSKSGQRSNFYMDKEVVFKRE